MDIESLFCFEQAELGLEQVVVIKRPALLSTKKIHFFKNSFDVFKVIQITELSKFYNIPSRTDGFTNFLCVFNSPTY